MPAYTWVFLHLGLAVWGVYHTLLYKRDSRAAMGWIMACVFMPFFGPISYYLFGINRVKARARGLRRRLFSVDYEIGERKNPADFGRVPGIRAIGHRITGRSATSGNSVSLLINGEAAYPAMLASIAQAKKRVYLASYILNADKVGTKFAEALGAAAARGVDVKVLIDGFGQYYSAHSVVKMLKKHQVVCAEFLPPRLLPLSLSLNLRNHRKLLVVDNYAAYAGGMNISQGHTAIDNQPREVSDLHFELRGPVIGELAALFCHDWHFASGKPLNCEAMVQYENGGDAVCRLIPDSPDKDLDALKLTIETVVSAATHSVDIMTPYFLPTDAMISAFQSAALRGVRVRIIVPRKNNLPFVNWAGQNKWAELLRWNVEIYYQPPPFCHAKLLCIDDSYSLIGSANIDPRSLRLNFELGIEVFSEQVNSELRAYFDDILSRSTKIKYEQLASRPIAVRIRDSAAALLTPYL